MANKYKTNAIELVQDEENGEVQTKVYYTPTYIKGGVLLEALALSEEFMGQADKDGKEERMSEPEMIDKLASFVADRIYNGQFSKDELIDGLHAPSLMQTLQEQVVFVSRGEQTKEAKKLVEKKN